MSQLAQPLNLSQQIGSICIETRRARQIIPLVLVPHSGIVTARQENIGDTTQGQTSKADTCSGTRSASKR